MALFYFVDVTTRRRDGRIALDRSPAHNACEAVIGARRVAELMFGDDFTPMPYGKDGHIEYFGENMYDEDVTVSVVELEYVPLHHSGTVMS